MRVIEKQMIAAIESGKNWTSGNTAVRHDPVIGGCEIEVALHGNLIAKRFYRGDLPGEWQVTLAGWNTPTTRSRLTAICHAFVPGCYGVGTRKGQAEIRYRDNNKAISDCEWAAV